MSDVRAKLSGNQRQMLGGLVGRWVPERAVDLRKHPVGFREMEADLNGQREHLRQLI